MRIVSSPGPTFTMIAETKVEAAKLRKHWATFRNVQNDLGVTYRLHENEGTDEVYMTLTPAEQKGESG